MAVRILGAIAEFPMIANGFGWIQNPAQTAESLGMPLLDGMGRSTQIGDFTSFFLSAALLALYGVLRKSSGACFAAALLLGLAAVGRLLATALHNAPLAGLFIGVEIVLAVVWIACGTFFHRVRST